MSKRKTLNKKPLKFATASTVAPAVIVKGRDREVLNPGLSDKAIGKIERYEASSQRAEQRLGTVRFG